MSGCRSWLERRKGERFPIQPGSMSIPPWDVQQYRCCANAELKNVRYPEARSSGSPKGGSSSLSRYDRPNSQNHKDSSRAAGNPYYSGWHVDCHYGESLSGHGYCCTSLSQQKRSLWAIWTALHLILLIVISSSAKDITIGQLPIFMRISYKAKPPDQTDTEQPLLL